MKRPRYSLRMLLIALAILSLPLSWIAYQLNWIRQRHDFFESYMQDGELIHLDDRQAPWPLPLFGETSKSAANYYVSKSKLSQAKLLFPEAHFTPCD